MLRITMASLLLFFCHFAHSSNTPQLPHDIWGHIIFCLGADSHSLQSLSCTNKDLQEFMHNLYVIRCNELKNYIANPAHGINPALVTFAPNNLRIYFIETIKSSKKSDVPSSFLVAISHYGDDFKKEEPMIELIDQTFHKNKLAQRIKPFILQEKGEKGQKINRVYMYEQYATTKDTAGELIGIERSKSVTIAFLYFKIEDLLIPSGWLANLLPKLHDAVINNGAANYTSWDACKGKSPLNKIRKKYGTRLPHSSERFIEGDGIVIFDLKNFPEITDNDRITLFKKHEVVGCDEFTALKYAVRSTEAMHMLFSWGHKTMVMENLPSIKPVECKIPSYGVFTVDAFDEEICFIRSGGVLKKVKVLHDVDQTYAHAFDYLKKQNVFVTKDWSVHANALYKTLKDFAATRYVCEHNANYLLVKDTVRSEAYVIKLARDGKIKRRDLRFIPSANLASCYLTKNSYECEWFGTDDAAPKE